VNNRPFYRLSVTPLLRAASSAQGVPDRQQDDRTQQSNQHGWDRYCIVDRADVKYRQ
jgi:hypothetical protein